MAERRQDEFLWQLSAELQRLSDEVIRGWIAAGTRSGWRPNVDIRETESSFIVVAELAGVDPSQVRVEYNARGQTLLIRGTRSAPHETESTGSRRLEILYGEFEREIPLDGAAQSSEDVRAAYRDGFLVVFVPKERQGPRRRAIRVRTTDE
ncbi:MAG: Hsp20/alpha crystallin family protein [Armatimonadota bacterium]